MNDTIEPGALAVINADALPTILAADKEDIFGRLLRDLDGFEPDVTTPEGRKEIASKAHKVARAKMDFVRLAGTLKESHQQTIKSINSEVRILEERMDALKAQVRKPLDDFEAREDARVEAHKAALREIEAWGQMQPEATASDIIARLANPPRDLAARDWQEFLEPAQRASRNAANALKVALAEAEERQAREAAEALRQAEEAERQRQEAERVRQEREAEIARQAAEQARIKAEREAEERAAAAERAAQAERDRIARQAREAEEAAARAERDRLAAEARARAAEAQREADRQAQAEREERARQAAIEAERQRVEREAAKQRAEQEARERNQAHRRAINRKAADAIVRAVSDLLGDHQAIAQAVVTAIAKGDVPAVTITY